MILFLDALAAFFMLVSGIIGFKRGLLEELGRLLGLIVASLVAMRYYPPVSFKVMEWGSISPSMAVILSFAGLFALSLLSMRLLTRFVHLALLSRNTRWLNQTLGFIFGTLKGAVIIALVIWVIDLAPLDTWSQILYRESRIAQNMTNARERIMHVFGWSGLPEPAIPLEDEIETPKINEAP